MSPWRCRLCAAAGQPSGPRYTRTAICKAHNESLRASGRRWCNKGGHVVPASAWAGTKAAQCRACNAARKRADYARNRERERQRARRLYHARPEHYRATRRAWHARNRVTIGAQMRARYVRRKLAILRGAA